MATNQDEEGQTIFGGALDEVDIVLLAPLLDHGRGDDTVLFVHLVRNHEHGEVIIALLADLRVVSAENKFSILTQYKTKLGASQHSPSPFQKQ